MPRRSGLVLAVATLAMMLCLTPAAAGVSSPRNPYTGTGYDASSAQCQSAPPLTADFAVIRDTGGRPFTADPCAAALWTAAGSGTTRAVYFNTGYSEAYQRDVTAPCSALAAQTGLTGKGAQAYAIGCSEAAYAIGQAPGVPVGWWADVETGNSWSTSDPTLNIDTLRGIVDRFTASHQVIGLYSTRASWTAITGGSSGFQVPEWVISIDGYSCSPSGAGFSGGPVWLEQTGTVLDSSGVAYDLDQAC